MKKLLIALMFLAGAVQAQVVETINSYDSVYAVDPTYRSMLRKMNSNFELIADTTQAHTTQLELLRDSSDAQNTRILNLNTGKWSIGDTSNNLATKYDISPTVINLTGTAIDWSLAKYSNKGFLDTLATSSVTYTFSHVTTGQTIRLTLVTDGSRLNVALWPATVYWPTGTTNPTSSMYASSVYELEFKANASDFIAGRLVDYRPVADTVTVDPDTVTPPAMVISTYANLPGRLEMSFLPSNQFSPSGYLFKVSPNVVIGETSVTDTTSTNYPTVSVQEVSVANFTTSAATMDVTLATTVDPTKTFVTLPTYEATNSYARANNLIVSLSDDGTKVTLTKGTTSYSSTITNIRFSVVTVSKWLSVQHIDSTLGSAASSIDLAIPNAVTLANTFPLVGVAVKGEQTEGNDFYQATFPSTTVLRLTSIGSQGGACGVSAQIITSDSIDVQTLTLAIASGDTTAQGALSPAVTVARTFSVLTYKMGSAASTNPGRNYAYGFVSGTTTYDMTRSTTTGATMAGTAYVGTFKAGWPVAIRQSLLAFAGADTSQTATITSSPVDRSIVWGTGYGQRTGIAIFTADSAEAVIHSIRLSDATTVTVEKGGTLLSRIRTEALCFPVGTQGGTADTVAFDSLAIASGYLDATDLGNGFQRYIITGLSANTTYYVAAKVVAQNGKISPLSNVVAVTTPAAAGAVNNGDWFVEFDTGSDDSAGTSAAKAFKTLGVALAAAVDGDTIRVGDTTEVMTTFTKAFDPPVVIKSNVGTRAVFKMQTSADSSATILDFQVGASGYVLDSIAVLGGGTWIYGRDQNKRITIKDSYFFGHLKNWAGIHITKGSDWTVQRNVIDCNGSAGSAVGVGRTGIWASNSSRLLIEYNTITNARWGGIAESMDDSRIRYNTLYGNKIPIAVQFGAQRNVIENNVSYWPSVIGYHDGHGGDGFHHNGDSNIVRFNVTFRDTTVDSDSADPWLGNIYTLNANGALRGVNGLRFYNNTFVNDTKGYVSGGYLWNGSALQFVWNDTSLQLKNIGLANNVIVGYDSCVFMWNVKTKANSPISELVMKGNLFSRWPTGGATGKKMFRYFISSWAYKTLAESKTSYASTFLSTNLDADPLFADTANNDWRPGAGSPLTNGGVALTTTSNAGTASNQLRVVDPLWFSDGQGLVAGDMVRCTSWSEAVRIVSISGTTLTLEKAMTWTLAENVFFGSDLTPNIGAY